MHVKGLLVHFETAGQWLWYQCLYTYCVTETDQVTNLKLKSFEFIPPVCEQRWHVRLQKSRITFYY
jgi:hypothetical protein